MISAIFEGKHKMLSRLALWVGLVVCAGWLMATEASEEKIRQSRIEAHIQIAKEQIKRGLYAQAEAELAKTDAADLAPFKTPAQQQQIDQLRQTIQTAKAERDKIAQMLQEIDALIAESKYDQAAQMLKTIQANPYVTSQEKAIVSAQLAQVEQKLADQQAQIQQLFNQAVADYQAGKLESARAAFEQVNASGFRVSGEKTAAEYIAAIDQQLAAQQAQLEAAATQPDAEQSPQAPAQPAQPAAVAAAPATEPPAPTTPAATTAQPQEESSYLQVIRRQQNIKIDYTAAIVHDALERSQQLIQEQKYPQAAELIRRAMSTVELNKLLLGDALYTDFSTKLKNQEQTINELQRQADQERAKQQQKEAEKLTAEIRQSIDAQRKQAIEEYMDRAYAFQAEQRYEEALGQLEQLLAIDPHNQRALIMKKSLEHWLRFIEQRKIQEEIEREEMQLLLETNRKTIPFSKEITYPRNWQEIVARREKALQEAISPVDVAVNKLLDQTVNLSILRPDTSFEEAIDILRNSVEPPLTIFVNWPDLAQNAFVERDTPIDVSGEAFRSIILRTALRRILEAISSRAATTISFVIEDGVITIATQESLPTRYKYEIYDVADLVNPSANFDEDYSGITGQGGGGYGGGGTFGSTTRGGGGTFGGGGGTFGGTSRTGGGTFGGGGGGGMLGGGTRGGTYGGGRTSSRGGRGGTSGSTSDVGNWRAEERAYQLIWTIQQAIEPQSWWEEGGEGRIDQYSETKLLIWQTPEVHAQIKELLKKLRSGLGEQIAIETRFLLVGENFLEDIGFDISKINLKVGGHWAPATDGRLIFQQGSAGLTQPRPTTVPGSLGGASPAFKLESSYGLPLDDLQVEFLIRATQMYQNSRQLTAPKAVVLNGESATLEVLTQKRIEANKQLVTDTSTTDGVSQTYAYWQTELEDLATGVTMSITPVMTSDKKYVILRIVTYLIDLNTDQQGTAIGIVPGQGQVQQTYTLPSQQVSSVMTRVAVPDRGTVMLGGLTLTADREVEAGVPILGKLPVLGRLFSNKSQIKDKQILLILVKPTIMIPEETEQDAVGALTRG